MNAVYLVMLAIIVSELLKALRTLLSREPEDD